MHGRPCKVCRTAPYASFDEGIEKITGTKPERVEPGDEDYELAANAMKEQAKQ